MIYFVSILANVYPTADKIVDPYDSNDRSLMVTVILNITVITIKQKIATLLRIF